MSVRNRLLRRVAEERYRSFVQAGKDQPAPGERLMNQIYLGDEAFVEAMQRRIDPKQSLKDIPRKQTQAPVKLLAYYAGRHRKREDAMARAYLSGHYTLEQVGTHFGVSYATVSRAVKRVEAG